MIAQIIKHFHLPNNTVVTDEDVDAILLRSVDEGDGIYGGDVVTIWKYYKKQNTIQEIVTAHPMADLLWYNPDKKHGVTLGIDSVFVASGAMLVPLNPDVVVVNGTIDKMEVTYTFLVDVDARKAILLPSNRGCIGFTSEEGLPIFAYLSDIMLMASLADILSFLFMMKKETSSRKCRLKIIKKMRSYDCNRIDNLYSAAQESNSCNFCVSIDSGKNSICIYWHARCWDV